MVPFVCIGSETSLAGMGVALGVILCWPSALGLRLGPLRPPRLGCRRRRPRVSGKSRGWCCAMLRLLGRWGEGLWDSFPESPDHDRSPLFLFPPAPGAMAAWVRAGCLRQRTGELSTDRSSLGVSRFETGESVSTGGQHVLMQT